MSRSCEGRAIGRVRGREAKAAFERSEGFKETLAMKKKIGAGQRRILNLIAKPGDVGSIE